MEEEALKREEEKMRVGTRLQVARGLGSLGQGAYEKAARELLSVKGDLGDWGKTVSQLFVYPASSKRRQSLTCTSHPCPHFTRR